MSPKSGYDLALAQSEPVLGWHSEPGLGRQFGVTQGYRPMEKSGLEVLLQRLSTSRYSIDAGQNATRWI